MIGEIGFSRLLSFMDELLWKTFSGKLIFLLHLTIFYCVFNFCLVLSVNIGRKEMQNFATGYGLDAANVRTRIVNCRRLRLKAAQKKKQELCIDYKSIDAVFYGFLFSYANICSGSFIKLLSVKKVAWPLS